MTDNSRKRNLLKPITLGMLLCCIIGAAVALYALYTAIAKSGSEANVANVEPYRGTDYEPPLSLQNFTLTSQTGEQMSLEDFTGQPILLFFGFTNCPDVCPLTLSEFKQVKALLQDQSDQVNFVFVSIDGARDTPEVLADFIGNFDSDFIGLTGDDVALTQIAQDFGAEFEPIDTAHSPHNYSMEHTARSYLIDGDGQLRVTFAYGTEAEILAERTRELLPE